MLNIISIYICIYTSTCEQVDDKIQVKYEITVTACGDSRRKCRSDVIGGMMEEVESRSRIRREVEQEVPEILGRFIGLGDYYRG